MVGGSYGGMGVLFFGVKLPAPMSSPSATALTADALAELERRQEEDAIRAAVRNQQSPSPPSFETVASELDHYEPALEHQEVAESEVTEPVNLGQEYGLSQPTPAKSFDVWGLLTGTQ